MKLSLLLGAALALGQTEAPSQPRAQLLPPSGSVVIPATRVSPKSTPVILVQDKGAPAVTYANGANGACGSACGDACGSGCGAHPFRGLFGHRDRCDSGCNHCDVQWCKPWKCEDLKMEPVEHKHHCHSSCCGGFLGNLFTCPEEPEENGNGEKKNGNGEKKNGNGEKKNGEEKKNGNGEEPAEEEEEDLNPLMQVLKCRFPTLFDRMECHGSKIYGWIQAGYTVNFDSPNDRLNYGVNSNNRSNDFSLDQVYLVLEKPLDLDKKVHDFHLGYRVDFLYGHAAPIFGNFAFGLFDNFTGDSNQVYNSGDYGFDMPQFYVEAHLPFLTKRGIDVRVGRFYTLLGAELTPAPQTDFYSHGWEWFYGVPYTHTGVMTNTHVGDTLDLYNGLVRGWEVVFEDNNDAWTYLGGATWTSCDKRNIWATAWVAGAEQFDNDDNDRITISSYYTRKFGRCDEFRLVGGGHIGWEDHAANGGAETANWYGLSTYLFYTVDPRLILGSRFEWFRDEDGVKTVQANRPGFKDSFYEVTLGFTYKPYQNVRVRPELRYDWSNHNQAFNDLRDRSMVTLGVDVVWEY